MCAGSPPFVSLCRCVCLFPVLWRLGAVCLSGVRVCVLLCVRSPPLPPSPSFRRSVVAVVSVVSCLFWRRPLVGLRSLARSLAPSLPSLAWLLVALALARSLALWLLLFVVWLFVSAPCFRRFCRSVVRRFRKPPAHNQIPPSRKVRLGSMPIETLYVSTGRNKNKHCMQLLLC